MKAHLSLLLLKHQEKPIMLETTGPKQDLDISGSN